MLPEQAHALAAQSEQFELDNRLYNTTFGKVCEVSVENGARVLTQESHRLATPEEIEAFKAAAESRRLANEAAEVRRLPSSFRVTLRSSH